MQKLKYEEALEQRQINIADYSPEIKEKIGIMSKMLKQLQSLPDDKEEEIDALVQQIDENDQVLTAEILDFIPVTPAEEVTDEEVETTTTKKPATKQPQQKKTNWGKIMIGAGVVLFTCGLAAQFMNKNNE